MIQSLQNYYGKILTGLLGLCLTILNSGMSAQACSPLLPDAVTETTYEDALAAYKVNISQALVNDSALIAVGQFKPGATANAHKLIISETLKPQRNTSRFKAVIFDSIEADRVSYHKKETATSSWAHRPDWFWAQFTSPDIEGEFGPGDCKTSLKLTLGQDYIVFLDSDNKVTSARKLNKERDLYYTSIKNIIDTPSEPYGVSFSLQDLLNRKAVMRILETRACSPVPEYNILQSANLQTQDNNYIAEPIMVLDEYAHFKNMTVDMLLDEVKLKAREKGRQQGLFTNAPSIDSCHVGDTYLSIGHIYGGSGAIFGQMIKAELGVFSLEKTIYEHHFTPAHISIKDASHLIETYNNVQ